MHSSSVKPKHPFRQRLASFALAGCLISSPILITQAPAAAWLGYIQAAQQILEFIRGGGLGSLDIGNLGEFLSLFREVPIAELQAVIQEIEEELDSLDPETRELISGITGTLGALGVPIPTEVNRLVKSINEESPDSFGSPYSLTRDQTALSALKISADSISGSVLGRSGQENIDQNLKDSEGAWRTGSDIVQVNGGQMVDDSVSTATDAVFSRSSLAVLKAISVQMAQQAALTQQMGASNAEQGKIQAMNVNMAAKGLAVNAQLLKVQAHQAKIAAAEAGARQADTQGAMTSAIKNAYMFSCLSATDCQK